MDSVPDFVPKTSAFVVADDHLSSDDEEEELTVVQSGNGGSDGKSTGSTSTGAAVGYVLPELVRNFAVYFHEHFLAGHMYELRAVYEQHFVKLTERYYKASPWPPAEAIAPLVNNDAVFLMVYSELCSRHIHARLEPTLGQRVASWRNYCNLFQYLLDAEDPEEEELPLPVQWLYEILANCVNQLESFATYRSEIGDKSEAEIKQLNELLAQDAEPKKSSSKPLWSAKHVLSVFAKLRAKVGADGSAEVARVVLNRTDAESAAALEELRNSKEKVGEEQLVAARFAADKVYRSLAYFSVVVSSRLHTQLGDYDAALKVVAPLRIGKGSLYLLVVSCYVSLFYHVAFAFLMQRRYADAKDALCVVLLYLSRAKQYFIRSTSYKYIVEYNEKMYALLAILMSLYPTRVDEALHSAMREKFGDDMHRIQRQHSDAFDDLFAVAAPFFLPHQVAKLTKQSGSDVAAAKKNEKSVSAEAAKETTTTQDADAVQRAVFAQEIREQALLPQIRSYLKLYTQISFKKFAAFLKVDEKQCVEHLNNYKEKTHQWVTKKDSLLQVADSERVWASDVHFDLDMDKQMVVIKDTFTTREYGDFFVRQITALDGILKGMQ